MAEMMAMKREFENKIVPPSWKDIVWSIEEFRKFHEDIVKDKR